MFSISCLSTRRGQWAPTTRRPCVQRSLQRLPFSFGSAFFITGTCCPSSGTPSSVGSLRPVQFVEKVDGYSGKDDRDNDDDADIEGYHFQTPLKNAASLPYRILCPNSFVP